MDLTISSKIENINKVSFQILDSLMPLGLDKSQLFDIRLCVEEAVKNAIEHGNKLNEQAKVKVSYSLDEGKLAVTVEDEGDGFNVDLLPDPTKADDVKDIAIRGRGVFLLKKLMDEVNYNEKGNKVAFVKYLKGAKI